MESCTFYIWFVAGLTMWFFFLVYTFIYLTWVGNLLYTNNNNICDSFSVANILHWPKPKDKDVFNEINFLSMETFYEYAIIVSYHERKINISCTYLKFYIFNLIVTNSKLNLFIYAYLKFNISNLIIIIIYITWKWV